jgi:ribonuclease HI
MILAQQTTLPSRYNTCIWCGRRFLPNGSSQDRTVNFGPVERSEEHIIPANIYGGLHPKKRAEASGGFSLTTNNRMEIYAAIKGLEMLKQPCHVTLYSDSQYVVETMTKGWAVAWKKKNWWRNKKERALNADLWERLLALCEMHQVEFRWVRGHAGNRENERCDQLSMAALRQPNLSVDNGYENRPETEGERPNLQEGEPCRKCSTPVVKRNGRRKPGRDYYYEFHLFCPTCKTAYHIEGAKRFVEQPPSLF